MTEPANDPGVYLKQPPTDEEHILSQQVDLHNGAPVPFWMFAKLVVRLRRHGQWIATMDLLMRKAKRHVWAGLGTLAANLVVIVMFAQSHARSAGAAEEHAAQQERAFNEYRDSARREIGELRQDIRELRLELRKMSGVDPRPGISIVTK